MLQYKSPQTARHIFNTLDGPAAHTIHLELGGPDFLFWPTRQGDGTRVEISSSARHASTDAST